jgi:hypothetical protein
MAWYQYKDQIPTNGLPKRIRLDDGSVRRNLELLSETELNVLGLKKLPNPPDYDYERGEDIEWDTENREWNIVMIKDEKKIRNKWDEIEKAKSKIIQKLINKLRIHHNSGNSLTEDFQKVIHTFDNLNSKNYSNPFHINLIGPRQIGISTDIGISQDEFVMLNECFAEYLNEDVYPISYDNHSTVIKCCIKEYWNIDCEQGDEL